MWSQSGHRLLNIGYSFGAVVVRKSHRDHGQPPLFRAAMRCSALETKVDAATLSLENVMFLAKQEALFISDWHGNVLVRWYK
jgi:hypothetical protein